MTQCLILAKSLLRKRLVLVESRHFGCFYHLYHCFIFVVSSLTATRDHHTISVILQSRFDPKELPGKSLSHCSSDGEFRSVFINLEVLTSVTDTVKYHLQHAVCLQQVDSSASLLK